MNIVVATSAATFWRPQAECMAQAMRSHGHHASVATWPSINQLAGMPCDLLLCIGSGESPQPFLAAFASAKKVLYLIESVPTLDEADDFTRSKLAAHCGCLGAFDHVFVHTRRSIPQLAALGVSSIEALVWPHFPSIYRPLPEVPRDLDVLFLGTPSQHRRRILELASSKFAVAVANNAIHEGSAALYARAKIALNIHYTPLRNFECRVIEVLGCGALLFTEALDPDDILLDGKHLVVFSENNLLELLDRHLGDQKLRERIAVAGLQEVQQFRVENQVERILEVADELGAGR